MASSSARRARRWRRSARAWRSHAGHRADRHRSPRPLPARQRRPNPRRRAPAARTCVRDGEGEAKGRGRACVRAEGLLTTRSQRQHTASALGPSRPPPQESSAAASVRNFRMPRQSTAARTHSVGARVLVSRAFVDSKENQAETAGDRRRGVIIRPPNPGSLAPQCAPGTRTHRPEPTGV